MEPESIQCYLIDVKSVDDAEDNFKRVSIQPGAIQIYNIFCININNYTGKNFNDAVKRESTALLLALFKSVKTKPSHYRLSSFCYKIDNNVLMKGILETPVLEFISQCQIMADIDLTLKNGYLF